MKNNFADCLKPGTILNNKYVVGGVIGKGGFGITYEGRDNTLDMKVAIKEYYPAGMVNRINTESDDVSIFSNASGDLFQKGKDNFLKEARILAKFSMEHSIVTVRDFFEMNNTAYIVMDYLEGINLKEYLEKNGRMSFADTYNMLKPIMKALDKIHEKGLIHRDISPSNIMLLNDGSLVLLDFGATREISKEGEKSLSIVLKPGFAPEEQYRTKGEQGPWTDIYALSATMYKMITGETPDDSMNRLFKDDVEPITKLNPDTNDSENAVIMKGMAVYKDGRFQSMSEMISACEAAMAGYDSSDDQKTLEINTVYIPQDDMSSVTSADKKNEIPDYPNACPKHQSDNKSRHMADNKSNRQSDSSSRHQADTKPRQSYQSSDNYKQQIPKSDKKKKITVITAVSAAVVIAVILLFAVMFFGGPITIGGETVDRNDTEISMYSKEISIKELKSLSKMKNLEKLTLRKCNLNNDSLKIISELHQLSDLNVDRNPDITDISSLLSMNNLSSISLNETGVSDISRLSELKNLKYIYLDYTPVSDISALSKFDDINSLHLSGTNVTDFTPLSEINSIYRLYVNETKVSDFSFLEKISGLNSLDFNNNTNLDEATIRLPETLEYINCEGSNLKSLDFLSPCIKGLRNIDASHNSISDISMLKNTTQLTNIYLRDNDITDISCFNSCTMLKIVVLDENKITDMSSLVASDAITDLTISENEIERIPELTCATSLNMLDISYNKLNDISGLSVCSDLNSVYLNDNRITDISPLANSYAMKYLTISNNEVEDISCLERCIFMQRLYLKNNKIVDISVLKNMPDLEVIAITSNKIKDISVIKYLPNIEKNPYIIDIRDNEIEDISVLENCLCNTLLAANNNIKDISVIKRMKNINKVTFHNNEISNYSPMNDHPTLRYASLYGNPITDHLKNLSIKEASAFSNMKFTLAISYDDEIDWKKFSEDENVKIIVVGANNSEKAMLREYQNFIFYDEDEAEDEAEDSGSSTD